MGSLGSCGWRVLSTTTVRETCLKDKLMSGVERQGPACFQACGPRNITSSCWISCFFDTVLGPDARHHSSHPSGGIPLSEIDHYWNEAFLPVSQGGCARVNFERDAAKMLPDASSIPSLV